MKKLLIATVVGTLSTIIMVPASTALAQTASSPAAKKAAKTATAKRKAASKKRVRSKGKNTPAAQTDPVLEGSVTWLCNERRSYQLTGDMKGDQSITVHWSGKNYLLPRAQTTTGANVFFDQNSGLKLVGIPTKAMLFSSKEDTRLADDCNTASMPAQGSTDPSLASGGPKSN